MEDISDRVARLSQELRAFQLELQWKSFQCSSPGDQDAVMDNLLNAGLGQDLKRTVDLLSQFLWCYIEAAAAGPQADADVDYARQSSRLGQITGILRQLHHSSCPLKDSLAFVEHAAMALTSQVDVGNRQEGLSLGKSA
jgi:hypothetical protein